MKSGIILWVDEAGRGAWAGPVVAGACAFLVEPQNIAFYHELADSKTLSEAKREMLFDRIMRAQDEGILVFSAWIIDPSIIDAVGIREANRRAMDGAMRGVMDRLGRERKSSFPTDVIEKIRIDGRDNYRFDGIDPAMVEYIVRGDGFVKEIQAAAIVAKVTRDRLMRESDRSFPGYGFDRHKGYGTMLHQTALATHGPLPIHRDSYAPIKKLILAKGSV